MGTKNNFPNGQIDAIDKPVVQQMVTDLKQLHDMGRPETDQQVKERIDQYFELCQITSIRPGIESLCLALHITRQTLFNWGNGSGCSKQRQELAQSAKAFIAAYIEQASLSGRLNPASSIFLLKNWCSYKDSYSFETTERTTDLRATQSPEEILQRIEQDIPIDEDCID